MNAFTRSAAMLRGESRLLEILPFLGVLPFVFGSTAVLLYWPMPFRLESIAFLPSYGLVILGFMAGVQWGQYLSGIRSSFSLPLEQNAASLDRPFALTLCFNA